MKKIEINHNWEISDGLYNLMQGIMNPGGARTVDLPHDYMIESDTDPASPGTNATAYYNACVKNYNKKVFIPEGWKDEQICLQFDGCMMNTTVEVNGSKVCLQHYGYAPFNADITNAVYFGEENRVNILCHAGTQPNSRWYNGAGVFRSPNLVHGPKLHIAQDGIYAYTEKYETDPESGKVTAFIKTQVTVENHTLKDRTAVVRVWLTRENSEEILIGRCTKLQVNANAGGTAYVSLTFDGAQLWSADEPNLYTLHASVTESGIYVTHEVPAEEPMYDETEILFGIRTVSADVRHGLMINGKTVKLKGGCLHHDNGLLGAVSLYDAEYRKLSHMKAIGYNAVRTTHNPPSTAFLDACDRLGMYVFDEAFDAWDIGKQPGDYNQYFASDWKKDMDAFMRRDRSRACVIIWSTGNEIPERGGLDRGYARATEIIEYAKTLDKSRPVSNAVCSFWSGLDDQGMMRSYKAMAAAMNGGAQNADTDASDNLWEENTEAFVNGLDIVGYNYMESHYEKDHEMYPERIMLGSENFPVEIGLHWPVIEKTPWLLGDFTWTAYDYIGEAGIGKAFYLAPDDPRLKQNSYQLFDNTSAYPWRTANDADFDINGELLAQGAYRSVVWGSRNTYVYSYDPANYGCTEVLSSWGFPEVWKNWNWDCQDGTKTNVLVFSAGDTVSLILNGREIGRKAVDTKTRSRVLPKAVLFEVPYEKGILTAVSYEKGTEISRDSLKTTGKADHLALESDRERLPANGKDLLYVRITAKDAEGNMVPDAEIPLTASLSGNGAVLAGFGTGNPRTAENYTKGACTTYCGKAMAILRAGYEKGLTTLKIESPLGIYTLDVRSDS